MINSKKLRNLWINFFIDKNHDYFKPVSLLPVNDPSLLWINSGVATLKDYFTGKKQAKNPRIVNVQKVLRTSDIENVGVTERHLTFFEMLGNFSIGDYFNEEAIKWAWEFLTDKKYLNLDKNKLFITVYEKDEQTLAIWEKIGIDKSHIILGDKNTNFWDMGNGPCGPNTEIYYDRGENFDHKKLGIRLLQENIENDRYLEIWNIVLSQFSNDGKNNYSPLPKKNIDTGAGFERFLVVTENVNNVFETNNIYSIILKIENFVNFKYQKIIISLENPETKISNSAFRICADHLRAVIMALSDNAEFSNKKQGYVLRRLIRRTFVNLQKLKFSFINLKNLVDQTVDILIEEFTDEQKYFIEIKNNLLNAKNKILNSILEEYKNFEIILNNSLPLLETAIINSPTKVDEKFIFYLYETHGLSIEISLEILKNHNIFLNEDKLKNLLDNHAAVSKSEEGEKAFLSDYSFLNQTNIQPTVFEGFETTTSLSKILYIVENNRFLEEINVAHKKFILIFDKTPFYAEAGGAVGDKGIISNENCFLKVVDVQLFRGNVYLHFCEGIEGKLSLNDQANLHVDKNLRQNVANNHTATHLLNYSLKKYFDESVKQTGSYIDDQYLRFDITFKNEFNENVKNQLIQSVNHLILRNLPQKSSIHNYSEIKNKLNIVQNFEDKYEDKVRVISFNEEIKELCGGIHATSTSLIKNFFIISTENKGKNILRIKAITGKTLNSYVKNILKTTKNNFNLLQTYLKHLQIINKKLAILKLKSLEGQKHFLQNYAFFHNNFLAITEYLKTTKKLLKFNFSNETGFFANLKKIEHFSQLIYLLNNFSFKNKIYKIEDLKNKAKNYISDYQLIKNSKNNVYCWNNCTFYLTQSKANNKKIINLFDNYFIFLDKNIADDSIDFWTNLTKKENNKYLIQTFFICNHNDTCKEFFVNEINKKFSEIKWFKNANPHILTAEITSAENVFSFIKNKNEA